MKTSLLLFAALSILGTQAHAADCTASVKETARSAPKKSKLSGNDSEVTVANHNFSVMADGANAYLTIVKPNGEEVSTYVPTPSSSSPATTLTVGNPNGQGGMIEMSCRF